MSYKTIIKTIMTLLIAMLLPSLSFADMHTPKIYTLKARLALKNKKQQVVSESLPFHLTKGMITPTNSGVGWIEKENDIVWIPGGKEHMFKIPLEIPKLNGVNIGGAASKGDFNELWIDYEDMNPQNRCDIGIILNLNPITELTHHGDSGQVNYDTAIGGSQVPMLLETINVEGSNWKENDRMSDFAGEFGFLVDKDWHYKQDNKRLVIKRRFHKNISTIEEVFLEFSIGTKIKDVALRLTFKDRPTPDVTVRLDELPNDNITVGGIKIVRILLGRYLRKNYPGTTKAFLEELTLRLDDQVGWVVKERPFKRLDFMYALKKSIFLPSRTDEVNTGLKRIKVDIQELSDVFSDVFYGNDNERALKEASLYVMAPPNVNNYCGIRLKGMRAVKNYEGEVPGVLSAIDGYVRGFGPLLDLSGDSGNVEAQKFLNYYSFGRPNNWGNKEISDKKGYLNRIDNLTGSKEFLMDGPGVKIITTNANYPLIFNSVFNDDKLVKEGGKGAQIEMSWSTDTIIEEDTYFLLQLSGGDEFVKSGLITMKTDSGGRFIRVFKPNKPLELTGIKGRITEISISMESYEGPFTIGPKDIYYFFGKSKKEDTLSRIDNLTGGKEFLMDSRDVKITTTIVNHPMISSSLFKDNKMLKEGKEGSRVQILWSTNTIIEENTFFILRLSIGVKFVKSGLITMKTDRGEQFIRVFKPNKPLDLSGIKGRITEISLSMELYEGPFTIGLADMALFSPVSLSPLDALNMPRPFIVTESLRPEFDNQSGVTDASWGFLKGIVWRHDSDAAGSFEWNTKVDNQTGIIGVHLFFENSRTVNAENLCWLSLTFIGEHNRVSRDVCGELQKKGEIYITIPDIFGDQGADKLSLITWKLDMGKRMIETGGNLSFNYRMYIERWAPHSIVEQIMMTTPILSVAGNSLYPKGTKTESVVGPLSGGLWLDMGTLENDIENDIANDIKVLDNPYLKVMSLVKERVLPATQHYMPEETITSPWLILIKTGAFLFIFAAFALGWLEGWWQRLWQKIKSSIGFISSDLRLWQKIKSSIGFISSDLRLWQKIKFSIGFISSDLRLWQKIKFSIGFISSYLRIIREKPWAKLSPVNIYKMLFWIILSDILYFLFLELNVSSFFYFGSLSGFMALRSLLWLVRPVITRRWSAASEMIYEKRGNVYLLGFIVARIGCIAFLVFKNELVAEQLAMIGYYCVVVGVAQKAWQGFIRRIIRETKWAKLLTGNLRRMIIWIILCGLLYFLGLNPGFLGLEPGKDGTNSYFVSVGGLFGFMALRSLLWLVRPVITRRWSAASEMVYEEKGNIYILGFMVTIMGCAVSLVLKSGIVAEQLAIIGYYCFLAGVAQKAWQMRKEAKPLSGD
ncbi:MAG: hypothetical protein HQK96_06860 [Nitrospirae bacterium]|nr:hypothetical protein [Nitrospirota bacterium]